MLFEGIVLKKLAFQIASVSKFQHGFCPGRSTISAIDSVVKHVRAVHRIIPVAKKIKDMQINRLSVAMVTMDISGAFDCVIWNQVVEQLKLKGAKQDLLQICENLLSKRSAELDMAGVCH